MRSLSRALSRARQIRAGELIVDRTQEPVDAPRAAPVVTVLGLAQIFAWGATYYLPAALARPIAADTGWSVTWIVAALSLGTITSGLAAPAVGRLIDRHGGRPVLASSALLCACGLAGIVLALVIHWRRRETDRARS